MINLILFSIFAYCLFTVNLACLRYLIDNGHFDKPVFTRSIRAAFMAPPFAILIIMAISAKESLSFVWENIKFVMTKRK